MATPSSVLAWRIPGTAEPGGLPSMGSQSQTRLKRLSSSSRLFDSLEKTLMLGKIEGRRRGQQRMTDEYILACQGLLLLSHFSHVRLCATP